LQTQKQVLSETVQEREKYTLYSRYFTMDDNMTSCVAYRISVISDELELKYLS